MKIRSRERLVATAGTEIRALADKRALARSLFYELDPYLSGSQFNKLDASIGFRCEPQYVITTLKHLGFKPLDKETLRRSDMVVKVHVPHEDWNPVLYVM